MFSATFPPHVEGLARQSLYKPVEVVIGDSGSAATNVGRREEGEMGVLRYG